MVSTWAVTENGGIRRLEEGDIILQALLGRLGLFQTLLEIMDSHVQLALHLGRRERGTVNGCAMRGKTRSAPQNSPPL